MAEIIGAAASAVTIAGLFKLCVNAFDFIRSAKNQEVELKRLNLKLNIEKCRLLVWGQAVGLDEGETSLNLLTDCPFQDIVMDALQLILQLLTDSQALSRKYGCCKLEGPMDDVRLLESNVDSPAGRFNAAFDKLKSGGSIPRMANQAKSSTRWVVHDRKKFGLLINESKELIDGLQDITKDLISKHQQERFMTSRIMTIHDQETLTMISEVCDSDHHVFSTAASFKADAITMAPSLQGDVSNWISTTEVNEGGLGLIESMEEWTIADFRQNYLALFEERGRRSRQIFPCEECGAEFSTNRDLQRHMERRACPMCERIFRCQELMVEHSCLNREREHWNRDSELQRPTFRIERRHIDPAEAVERDDIERFMRYFKDDDCNRSPSSLETTSYDEIFTYPRSPIEWSEENFQSRRFFSPYEHTHESRTVPRPSEYIITPAPTEQRRSIKLGIGIPRHATFRRQQSESLTKLLPAQPCEDGR